MASIKTLMTRDVATVDAEATIAKAAEIMIARGVSGLPVVDRLGNLIGMVTEGDLLRRAELGTQPRPSWWLRLLTGDKALASDYAKAHGRFVREVMTRSVVALDEDASVARAAELMNKLSVKRLPVVRDGKLVGVIARRDLLKALAAAPAPVAVQRSDADIAADIRARVMAAPWITLEQIFFTVDAGVVAVSGRLSAESQRQALVTLIENTTGVSRVTETLIVDASLS